LENKLKNNISQLKRAAEVADPQFGQVVIITIVQVFKCLTLFTSPEQRMKLLEDNKESLSLLSELITNPIFQSLSQLDELNVILKEF